MFTITRLETFEQDIKKSRFLAVAAPVANEEEAKAFLQTNSQAGANHNCFAWRMGQNYRFNDDGEPSGTAGKPILQAIDGLELDNVVVVVTRWFGGILLGSGGLIRAYGGTAALCLRAAEKQEVIPLRLVNIRCGFSDHALLKARLGSVLHAQLRDAAFLSDGVEMYYALPEDQADTLLDMVRDLTRGQAVIKQD
ncbi:IMPACT family protein [Paenochrobactrum sp. BZR 588]|uniref:IMPACT family protein n=1 Tax=unclassified Paenochrobactrum TaxID=2639760 RepID=UPI003853F594